MKKKKKKKKGKEKTFPVRERLHRRLQVLPAAACRCVLSIAGHDCSGTSPGKPLFMGHLHSGDTKFGAGKNFHIIFKCVTAIEVTPLFRGKEHIFLVPKPGFDLHSGGTKHSKHH